MIDLIASLAGLVIPPLMDFVKKKFIPAEAENPERTAADLATSKPEVLPDYIKSITQLKDVDIKFFNRDVIGSPSQLVINLRAMIRPVVVCIAIMFLGLEAAGFLNLNDGTRVSFELLVTSWFGTRISLR